MGERVGDAVDGFGDRCDRLSAWVGGRIGTWIRACVRMPQ